MISQHYIRTKKYINMDEQVINELLEQLRQNLKKIESAREQVEKTVEAYAELKEDVRHYAEELSFIVQNTRTMISQLAEIKEKFLGNISVTIIEEIKSAVRVITEQINALSAQITSVYDMVEAKSQTILSTINNRSNSIDSTLKSIHHNINNLYVEVVSISNHLGQILTSLNDLKDSEKIHFDSIIKRLEDQEAHINIEFEALRKQNMILSFVIIVLLIIIGIIVFYRCGMV